MYSVCAFILTPQQMQPPNDSVIVEARNSIKSLVVLEQKTTMSKEHEITQKSNQNGGVAMRESPSSSSSSVSASSACLDSDPRKEEIPFDKINVESELARTHTERREPNGTVYFVERRTSEDFALQMLDKAIEPAERDVDEAAGDANLSQSPPPGAMSSDEVEPPIETVALVHREGDANVRNRVQTEADAEAEASPTPSPEDNDSGILIISQMSLNDPNPDSHPIVTHMEGTKTLPLNRSHKYNRAKSLTMGPVKSSKSDTDLRSMLFEEIKRLRSSEEEEGDPLEATESRGSLATPVEALSPTIPEPPKFDQEKFDQIGTMPRQKVKVSTMKRKAPSPPVNRQNSEEDNKPTSPEAPDTTVTLSSPNFASFKNKLEALYSRGPPNNFDKSKAPEFNRSKSYNPISTTAGSENPSADDKFQLAKVNLRPTDTVHRQKLIFNDVLKSINPDTRPSDNKNEPTKES